MDLPTTAARLVLIAAAAMASVLPLAAAEERLTLKDGRQFIGDYDEDAQVIVVPVGKGPGTARIRIDPAEVVSREPFLDGEPAESDEHRRLRESREAEAAAAAAKQLEVQMKLDQVERERTRAEVRAADEKRRMDAAQRATERAQYWARLGFLFPTAGLSAAEIDAKGRRHQYAAELTRLGYVVDTETMTISDMNRVVADEQRRLLDEQARAVELKRREEARLAIEQARLAEARARAERIRIEQAEAAARAEADRQLAETARIAGQQQAEQAERKAAHDRVVSTSLYAVVPVALCLYMLPTVIAMRRWHRNWIAILILNLGLLLLPVLQFTVYAGLTNATATLIMAGIGVLGWLGALIWSIIRTERDEERALRLAGNATADGRRQDEAG